MTANSDTYSGSANRFEPPSPLSVSGESDADIVSDLLVALKLANTALAMVTAFEDDARYIMGNTNFAIVTANREAVLAAIAKAEGRS